MLTYISYSSISWLNFPAIRIDVYLGEIPHHALIIEKSLPIFSIPGARGLIEFLIKSIATTQKYTYTYLLYRQVKSLLLALNYLSGFVA